MEVCLYLSSLTARLRRPGSGGAKETLHRAGIAQSSLPGPAEIRIQEAYRDYQPPFDVKNLVHKLLLTVPAQYFQGPDCIVLTNESSLSRRDRVGKVWARRRKHDKSRILGRYFPKSSGRAPYIELRVDRILAGLPGMWRRITMMREVVFGNVLFHEIGHHIHYTVRPEHEEKGDVADHWAGKLNGNAIKQNYWYRCRSSGPR